MTLILNHINILLFTKKCSCDIRFLFIPIKTIDVLDLLL